MTEFILASASPRRKELLEIMGLDFNVVVSDADESAVPKDIPARLYVQELALLKAAATAKTVLKKKNAVIISADTIVTLDGEILGKPKDEADAYEMLSALGGRVHEVYTGYCVMRIRDGKTVCKSEKTEVEFKPLTDDKIRSYINTREPMDKAGAYGIQGKGSMLINRINGDYFNVVGLPVSALADTLEGEFEIDIF
ncbi:MAG: Maf family protein [Firmicutes bacterium]|nr:Maf family protein [Bacillota bacterium]